jgi:multiple sugar transport system substrate-binding protein
MTARRRVWTAPAYAIPVLLAGITACSGDAVQPPVPPDGNTITWYVGSTDQNQKDYARVLTDEFEVANPAIKVKIVYAPKNTDSARSAVIDALRPGAANPPDVYLGDVIWPAEFVSHGRALPLDDQFEPDFWTRYDPELLRTVTYHGRIYAAPFFADRGMLYYRTDLVPTPPTTWEELAARSGELVRQRKVRYGYAWQGSDYEGLTCVWTEILADAGGRTLTPDGSRSAIDSPAGMTALRFLRNLISDQISPPGTTGYEESEASQVFASGQAAFMRGWNTAYSRLFAPNAPDNPLRGKVGVAPLPTFAGRPGPGYSTIGGWNLYLNPATQRRTAAKTFIRWLTSFQAQFQMVKFSQIPTNIEARRDGATQQNPAIATGFRVTAVARPSNTPQYPAVSRAVYANLHAALDGTVSLATALQRADHDIDDALN